MPVSIIDTNNNTYRIESRRSCGESAPYVWLKVEFPAGSEDAYSYNAGGSTRLTWAGDSVVEFLRGCEIGRTFYADDAAELARELDGLIFTRTGYEWTQGDINQELRKLIGSGRIG